MVDTKLFKERFKNAILSNNAYGSIRKFALKEGYSIQKVYRWTSTSSDQVPHESERHDICDKLGVSYSYLFPPQSIGLEAAYYVGFLEALVLRGRQKEILETLKNKEDHEVSGKFWATLHSYKDPTIFKEVDHIWSNSDMMPSLETVIFNNLFNNQTYKEYLVELALLLMHYMGGRIQLFEKRILLALKASSVARELSNDPSSKTEYYRLAEYLLRIDSLAYMYMRAGKADEAAKILEEIAATIPDKWPNTNALCFIYLARAYTLQDRLDEAERILTRVQRTLNQITNELVKVRYYMISGDLLRKNKKAPHSLQTAYEMYIEGELLQNNMGIEGETSGLGYRLGFTAIDMALESTNAIRDSLLASAKQRFENLLKYKSGSTEEYNAMYGLARIAYVQKNYNDALRKAKETQQKIRETFSKESISYLHFLEKDLSDLITACEMIMK
jgi:tetratricopeptide (TPR) repeat protein